MRQDSHASPLNDYLTQAVDAGLASLVFAAPFFMSGRHAAGLFVFVLLSCLTFSLWVVRQSVRRDGRVVLTGAEAIWIGAALLLVLQVTPLPIGLLSSVAPQMAELLPIRGAEPAVGLSTWNQASLDPSATRGALVLLLAYAMTFTVAANRIRKLSDAYRLCKWIGVAVGLQAGFALLQMFVAPNNTFGFYDIPDFTRTAGARGAFPNPNHFGHFAALGVGPLLAWTTAAWRERAGQSGEDVLGKWLAPAMLLVVMAAAILTYSRGAAIGIAASLLATSVICGLKGVWNARALAIVGACLLIVCGGMTYGGFTKVDQELNTLQQGIDGLDNSHIRRSLWAANMRGANAFPLLGVGGAAHAEAYRSFLDRHFEEEMTHAENSYLQILFEGGYPALLLLAVGILLGVVWAARAVKGEHGEDSELRWLLAAGVIGSLAAGLAHAVVDFIWYVPAIVSFTLVLLAILCRLGRLDASQPTRTKISQPLWRGAVAFAIAVSIFMVHNRVAPLRAYSDWQAYLDLSLRGNEFSFDANAANGDAVNPLDVANVDRMISHLERVTRLDPNFARAHVRLAMLLERKFEIQQANAENAMPLAQFRDAAYASGFTSKSAQEEWLTRAMGENREILDRALQHARRGLTLCPMYGEAYCSLSSLAFLEGHGPDKSKQLVEQAVRVRPQDGLVLLTAGVQAIKDGDMENAQKLLKVVFNQEPKFRREIINLFGFTVSPESMLGIFEPNYEGLKALYAFYREHRIAEGMRVIGAEYAAKLEAIAAEQKPKQASPNLHYAHTVYYEIGMGAEALRAIEAAADFSPYDEQIRHALALRQAEAGKFDDALKNLKWCAQRRPQDTQIRDQLLQVNRLRLAAKMAPDQRR